MKSSIPKVLHEVCGKPIIQYVLDIVKSIGSLKTYVVLGHKSSLVKKYLPQDKIVIEQKQLLGTADAVKCAANYFRTYSGNVLVLCGDTPLLNKNVIRSILRKHKRSKAICTFLTAIVHDPQGYGRIIREDAQKVVAIREDKDAVGFERDIAEINVGVYCFKSKELFKTIKEVHPNKKKKEYYLTDIIELFFSKGYKIETVETEDSVEGLGVNSREHLALAENIIRHKILKKIMSQGVTVIDPHTTYIDSNVKIGKDTTIRPFTYIEKNVRIGERCIIGPFARIRLDTRIGNNVDIGNFTEISRSKMGSNCFMKHFSYLGDSLVGSHVNIGAGMVTANFDGKQKHTSRIADYAFIGSNSTLISPVKIGKKAVVGAGSVVTGGKIVPDGRVVMGVPAKIVAKKEEK
ncbi:MAG: NTP transferase domain-containing protein [Candidatus Omnitrophica bacterium]|nr:NTP transferase domain-containing protein [Candidatus Omnitrophota bacterium]MBU4333289.1 NTP transferase domain-containing protein [Candidatus Omnitrophota bacterium]